MLYNAFYPFCEGNAEWRAPNSQNSPLISRRYSTVSWTDGWMASWNLHDAQYRFRIDVGTESAILGIKYTVNYTKRRTYVFACFLDISLAFQLVSYEIMWEKLWVRKVPAALLRIFQYCYYNQMNSLRWANGLCVSYRLECGVKQWGITFKTMDFTVNKISCEEDMVLLCPTVRALRYLLTFYEGYRATVHKKKASSGSLRLTKETMGRASVQVLGALCNRRPWWPGEYWEGA